MKRTITQKGKEKSNWTAADSGQVKPSGPLPGPLPSYNDVLSTYRLSSKKYNIEVDCITKTGLARDVTEAGIVTYTESVRRQAKV